MIRVNLGVYRDTLYASFSHRGKQFKFSLKIRIRSNQWDKKRQRIKPNVSGSGTLQKTVDAVVNEFLGVLYELESGGEISYDSVKEAREKPPGEDFFTRYDRYIRSIPGIRENTRKKKFSTRNVLYRYCRDRYITPDLLYWTPENFGRFVRFLQFDLDHRDGTISRHTKELKSMLHHYKVHMEMDLAHVSYSPGPSSVIYLNSMELDLLWKRKLTGRYDVWRDIFIFLCYTGMRYGDAMECSELWLDENHEVLSYVQSKTNSHAAVPFLTKPHLILTKYGGKLPRTSNQKLNKGLKKLFTYCGITRKVPIEVSRRGKVVTEFRPLNEVITSHCGRKTFIMRAVLANVPQDIVKKMSGHRGDVSLRPYIKIADRHVLSYKNALDA